MRMKSYFAATMETALNLARLELGPDAMLVDSRRTGVESRHIGEYEVVCAALPSGREPPTAARPEPAPPSFRASGGAEPSLDRLCQDVTELKRYMERIAANIGRSNAAFANSRENPELAEAFSSLTAAEVDPALAQDIVAKAGERTTAPADLTLNLGAEIRTLLSVNSKLERLTAFAGPAGSGKTTALVKIAAQFGIAMRKPVQILSLDTYRIAAVDQLRSYAAILGANFQVLETTAALARALEEHRHKDLVLIDTPGFGCHDIQEGQEIAQFLSTYPGIDTHLVLPVSMKQTALKTAAEMFSRFKPAKLLFTKLDETETFGAILNSVVRTGLPVSFLASGQRVPEDLELARKDLLTGLILSGLSLPDCKRHNGRDDASFGHTLSSAMAAA